MEPSGDRLASTSRPGREVMVTKGNAGSVAARSATGAACTASGARRVICQIAATAMSIAAIVTATQRRLRLRGRGGGATGREGADCSFSAIAATGMWGGALSSHSIGAIRR